MTERADGPLRERVQEVDPRSVWPDEKRDFTPAVVRHLGDLGQRLGLQLSEPRTEVGIGNFFADVVARTSAGSIALIENQLTASDHRHLGQLMTYVGGLDDVAVAIWTAHRFRPEHRRALVRLNEWSPAEIEFYGVEIAAIQIGDSEVVPDFRPIAFPQDWDPHRESGNVDHILSAKHRTFFEDFLADLTDSGLVQVVDRGLARRRLQWSEDHAYVTYRAQFLQRNRVSVSLILEAASLDVTKVLFDRLYEQRRQIESELDAELKWSRQPGRRTSIVRWRGAGSIRGSGAELERVSGWMRDSLARLRTVCNRRLDLILDRLGAEVE